MELDLHSSVPNLKGNISVAFRMNLLRKPLRITEEKAEI